MPTSPLEHKSWLRCYLDTGIPGHLAMLVFLGALAFAAVIYRKRLSLRYRLAFLPLALVPLVSGIMGCCYDYAAPERPRVPQPQAETYGTIRETPLQVVAMGSMQTGILLLIFLALLLHKDAIRPWKLEQEEP